MAITGHGKNVTAAIPSDFGFIPDPGRTAATDLAIRRSLADSVALILDRAESVDIGWSGDREAWRARLLAEPMAPPLLWAGYHALVQAVVRGDGEAVSALASELLADPAGPPSRPGRVVTVSANDLGAVDAARTIAIIDSDPGNPLGLRAVAASEVARISALLADARALLAQADPDLLDEIDTLGHLVVLAVGADGRRFGGAASVFLWGAVILNPVLVPDCVTLVEGLAHETAHALLFGLTLGANLTLNDPSERYASPLRADPRPIEGIVHAVYVLARMIHALERLQASKCLGEEQRALVARKLAHNRASYVAGLRTVDSHARFTPEGAEIFEACRRAMAAGMAAGVAEPVS